MVIEASGPRRAIAALTNRGLGRAIAAAGIVLLLAGHAGAQTPAPTVTQQTTGFDKWSVSCEQAANAAKYCVARLNVVSADQPPRPVLFLLVARRDNVSKLYVQTPTSIQLKPGVQLSFGRGSLHHFEFSSCEPALCTAEIAADAALLQELGNSGTATAIWTSLTAGEVKAEFAIDGGKEALDFLAKQSQAR